MKTTKELGCSCTLTGEMNCPYHGSKKTLDGGSMKTTRRERVAFWLGWIVGSTVLVVFQAIL